MAGRRGLIEPEVFLKSRLRPIDITFKSANISEVGIGKEVNPIDVQDGRGRCDVVWVNVRLVVADEVMIVVNRNKG